MTTGDSIFESLMEIDRVSLDYLNVEYKVKNALKLAIDANFKNEDLEAVVKHNKEVFNKQTLTKSDKTYQPEPIDRQAIINRKINLEQNPCFLVCDTPNQLALLLLVIYNMGNETSYDSLESIYYHEVEHWTEAIAQKFPNPYFVLYFYKLDETQYIISPRMECGKIPDFMTDDQYHNAQKQVLKAPLILTDGDKRSLE